MGRSQYCLGFFFTWKTPPHTHSDSNTPIVSFFMLFFFQVCLVLCLFIVSYFMATFITLFLSLSPSCVYLNRLVNFGSGSASHRFLSNNFWCEISLFLKMKFFVAKWSFSPSDWGWWSLPYLVIIPAFFFSFALTITNTVPADRSRWTISFKRDIHNFFSPLCPFNSPPRLTV
jgi:hypothetical protein